MVEGTEQLTEAEERTTREEIAHASALFAVRLGETADRLEQTNVATPDVDHLRGVSAICELLACAAEKAIPLGAFADLSGVYIELSNAIGEIERHDVAADAKGVTALVTALAELAMRATKVANLRPKFEARAS